MKIRVSKRVKRYTPEGVDAFEVLERLTFQSAKHVLKSRVRCYQVLLCILKGECEHSRNKCRYVSIILFKYWKSWV